MTALEMTQEQLDTLELTHHYGGEGFCFIRDIGDEMCQAGWYDAITNTISNVFLAQTKLLSETYVKTRNAFPPEINPPMKIKELSDEQRAAVAVLRAQLESGEAVIESQRVKLIKAA